MTALPLRPYQDEAIEAIREAFRGGARSVVLQAPTGSGKTVLTAHMIRGAAERGLRSWFLVHRKELLEQTSGALTDLDVPHGRIIAGTRYTPEEVHVASVQTLVRRLDKLPTPDMVVVDECHHATANTYRKILGQCPEAWIIGLTATPARTDGTGLGDIFEALVQGPELRALIDQGYLSDYRIVAPPSPIDMGGVHTRGGDFKTEETEEVVDRATITGDAIAHYREYVAPRSCLVYCVSRRHARHVAGAYQQEGINAQYVAGDTPKEERDAAIKGFRNGIPPVIVSVDLFGEGLDVPGLGAVQLLRPTQSLGLHLQQIGRSLRKEEGKDRAVVLDHVGNTWRHGLPDDKREWTLEGRKRKKGAAEEAAIALRHCGECFAIFPARLLVCPLCGAEVETQGRRPPMVIDGKLIEMDPEAHRKEREREQKQKKREQGMAKGLEALVRLARERGNQVSWAGIVHASRTGMPRGAAIAEAYRIARRIGV